jgi:hypothetical protein
MARTAAADFWSLSRALARTAQLWLAASLVLIASTGQGLAQADPVKGEATFTEAGGYARLVIKLT